MAAFHFASLEVLREIFAVLGACTSHETQDGTHAKLAVSPMTAASQRFVASP